MGSGTSRGKRVAPADVSEVNVAKKAATSPKQDSRAFKPLKIHAILRNARNRAQPDSHSEGHDSDFSREDEDIDAELDTLLAEYEERERASMKKNPPKRTVIKSKTYGLCHFGQEDEEEFGSAPVESDAETRGSHGGSRDINKRNNDAFTHFKKRTSASHSQKNGFLTRGALLEAVPTPGQQLTLGSCHSSSLTMPVILYDGSEEELMDTIEREFS
ncbi:uncharacterized protein LOC117805874 [Notolabrus celidotus]|uniref:uncharacterized protein LOC117805874 n=1 Tax=Notolabrus celidotus TaxID=1203425 RepID=UPI00148F8AA7|nr:uncharacterized protein LOC117805874 [Notolabrus celidotus]